MEPALNRHIWSVISVEDVIAMHLTYKDAVRCMNMYKDSRLCIVTNETAQTVKRMKNDKLSNNNTDKLPTPKVA